MTLPTIRNSGGTRLHALGTWRATTICLAIMLVSPRLSSASINRQYTESFDTTTYKDAAQTTADWNTAAGELRLFPFQPIQVGAFDTPGSTNGIVVDGDHAFVADFTSGMEIMDVSNPASPVLLSTFAATVQGMVASGDYVYVAAGSGGLKIVSITNPAAPVQVGSLVLTGSNNVAISGDHAYIADGSSGLRIISISNPAAPSLVSTFNTTGSATDVEADGRFVYVADGAPGFLVFDVSTPAAPALLTTVNTPGNNFGIDVHGNRAYVIDSIAGLQIYDITTPASPVLLGSLALGLSNDVFAEGDRAYVAGGTAGIHVVDISNEASPQLLYTFDTTDARDIFVDGDIAYVADASSGLRAIRVSTLTNEGALVGNAPSVMTGLDVAIAGTLAYVAAGADGLRIVDISDVAAPVLRGTYNTAGTALCVAVQGGYAYVGDSANLLVINVSNPNAPALVSTTATTATAANGIFVDGEYAYLGCANLGLRIYNISNPAAPAFVGSYDTPGSGRGLVVAGDRAFLADSGSGLQIINVSNPASPSLTGTYDTPGTAYDVAVAGDVAYIADRFSIQVLNISNLAAPTALGAVSGLSEVLSLSRDGDRLYATECGTDIAVVDVSDPSTPTVVLRWSIPCPLGVLPFGAYAVTGSSFQVVMLRQDKFDLAGTQGQSLTLSAAVPVVRARLTTSQSGILNWYTRSNTNGDFISIVPGGSAVKMLPPGPDLIFRTYHRIGFPVVNSSTSSATMQWFYESAECDRIADVPNDQGGQARISFGRSGYDFVEETTTPVTGYQIYRRVDPQSLIQPLEKNGPARDALDHFPGLRSLDPAQIRSAGDRTFVTGGAAGKTATGSFPPGTWEVLSWVAARQTDQYTALVPTLHDSTAAGAGYTTYLISTHTTTPATWYLSEPDSGYSKDNIPPAAPAMLHFSQPQTLAWAAAPETDFAYFSVYGSSNPAYDGSAVLIGNTVNPASDVSGSPFAYYHVTATDDAGLHSSASSIQAQSVDVPDGSGAPKLFAFHAARPNPTSAATEFAFDLPGASGVSLAIFDASGRLVRTLAHGSFTQGRHLIRWDGRDAQGHMTPAGVYFARIEAAGRRATQRVLRLE